MKRIMILITSIIFMCVMLSGCGFENDLMTENRTQNNVYVPSSQVVYDVEKYLKDKYNKEFKASVSDSPNHIYSSYSVSVLDDENNFFDVSITYQDEEHYSVTDRYNIYAMKHDFEKWFKELADPYIDCKFKVFWRPGIGDLSNDYNECKTAEDFLELSPTSSYYGLRF